MVPKRRYCKGAPVCLIELSVWTVCTGWSDTEVFARMSDMGGMTTLWSYFWASYDSSWSWRRSCAELSRDKADDQACFSVGACFCFCVLGEAFGVNICSKGELAWRRPAEGKCWDGQAVSTDTCKRA